jgi:hypothetical protein
MISHDVRCKGNIYLVFFFWLMALGNLTMQPDLVPGHLTQKYTPNDISPNKFYPKTFHPIKIHPVHFQPNLFSHNKAFHPKTFHPIFYFTQAHKQRI